MIWLRLHMVLGRPVARRWTARQIYSIYTYQAESLETKDQGNGSLTCLALVLSQDEPASSSIGNHRNNRANLTHPNTSWRKDKSKNIIKRRRQSIKSPLQPPANGFSSTPLNLSLTPQTTGTIGWFRWSAMWLRVTVAGGIHSNPPPFPKC